MVDSLLIDVARHYPGGPSVRARLELPLDENLVTVLFGESGSGKTTLLRCVAGLDRPDEGRVLFGTQTWSDRASGAFLSPQRRAIGYLVQDYALFPHLSVRRNIAYGLHALARAERARRVEEVARLMRIEALLDRHPSALSGGQRQRVALARTLAPRPRLLLLDEPLSALDAPTREELRGELRRVLDEFRIPALIVTHDRTEALALGDRIAVLAAGELRQFGPIPEVFGAPCDADVARVVGVENVLAGRIVARQGGLATVAVGTGYLVVVDPGSPEGDAFVCIRAEDVILEPAATSETSASNELASTIIAVTVDGPLARVRLDCGFPLNACVTRHSAERLQLTPGRAIAALIKAPAIRVIPRDSLKAARRDHVN